MNREDIIKLAREAGFQSDPGLGVFHKCDGGHLERFAALIASRVAAAEREACIDIVAMHGGSVEIEAAIRARGETK